MLNNLEDRKPGVLKAQQKVISSLSNAGLDLVRRNTLTVYMSFSHDNETVFKCNSMKFRGSITEVRFLKNIGITMKNYPNTRS